MKRLLRLFLLALCLLPAAARAADETLILATTTSTQDTGLLDELVPRFEAAHHVKVKTIAVGSGEALAMGRRGDADVLLVHSRAAEDRYMADGFGALRLEVMYNDFVLVGPASDPAGVKGMDAQAALRQIAAKAATFVSRDDQSGTHRKELDLWQRAGIVPGKEPWYLRTGQGMGETVRIASEKQGYTLIDRGTWLALRPGLALAIVSEGAKDLLNTYRVIVVNPERFPRVHVDAARRFAEWIVSPEVQRFIGEFGRAKYGQPLFTPNAAAQPK